MKRNITLSTLLAFVISGCSSAPTPPDAVVPESKAYDEKSSHALNIANQTFLTQEYEFGLKTIESPLRDFTKEEVEQAEVNLRARIVDINRTRVINGIRLLMGDFYALTDHAMAETLIASTNAGAVDHPSSQSAFIIAVDAKGYKDGVEAMNASQLLIAKETVKLLKEKGEDAYLLEGVFRRKVNLSLSEDVNVYSVVVNGFFIGLQGDDSAWNDGFSLGKTSLIDSEQQFVTTEESDNHLAEIRFNAFLGGDIPSYKGLDGWEQFKLDLTARLPEGFYYYQAPFPESSKPKYNKDTKEFDGELDSFTLFSPSVPSIYHQGKRYDFIKPELSK